MTKNPLLKPIGNGECFLLDLEGHKTVTVKLPVDVTTEISGQDLLTSEGPFAKLKSKLGLTPKAESWLVVTSVDNPLLEQLDKFKALVVEQLVGATARPVTKSNLMVSASVPVNGKGQLDDATKEESLRSHVTRN